MNFRDRIIDRLERQAHIERSRHIKRTLGIRAAAGYLRNRGWSVEAAAFILCGA